MQTPRPLAALLAWTLLLPLACGGPPAVQNPNKKVEGSIAGVVVKGLVAGATVTAYQLVDGQKGNALGVGTTDANGSFDFKVGLAKGNLLLEAISGSYTDEASGQTEQLGSHALTAIVPAFAVGSRVTGIQVNPVTTFIAAYTPWRESALGETFDVAYKTAQGKLGGSSGHFKGADWSAVLPTDLTSPSSASGVSLADAHVAAGLMLAGLSQEAVDISRSLGVSDTAITPAALTDALAQDIGADGLFDGRGLNGSQLSLFANAGAQTGSSYDLSGATLRGDLAQGMIAFLGSTRNASPLTRADADALIRFIAKDGPAPGQVTHPGDYIFATPGTSDVDPPTVQIVMPTANAGIRGDTAVKVTISDTESDIDTGSIRFADMGDYKEIVPTATGAHSMEVTATLQAGAIADGPFTVQVFASDVAGNLGQDQEQVIVANSAPTIVVTSPAADATVKGLVSIEATAVPNSATHAKIQTFEIISPAGLKDNLASADAIQADWDTTASPEGDTILTLEATDQYGSKATANVHVVVDNRPAPELSGQVVVAGNPVQYPQVTIRALDATATNYYTGTAIGSTVGDSSGHWHVVVTNEAYTGPVSVVVTENTTTGSPTIYHDPVASDTGLDIPFGSSDVFATYLPDVTDTGGANWTNVVVSPWTTIAASLAWFYNHRSLSTLPAAEAATRAATMIAGHFSRNSSSGMYSLIHDVPIDPTQPFSGAVSIAYPGLADEGLNQLAADLNTGLPGKINALDLVHTFSADISDGLFDGMVGGTALPAVGGVVLDSYTTRNMFALEIDQFINGPANTSGMTTVELKTSGFYDDISLDDREIYPPSQPGREYDTTPPVITWVSPASDGLDVGTAQVDVKATAMDPVLDASGLTSFVITDPPELAGQDLDATTANVHVMAPNTIPPNDVSAANGRYDVKVTVQATDLAGNVSTSSRSFTRPAPTVHIDSVSALASGGKNGSAVHGPFQIVASGTEGYATQQLVLLPVTSGVNDPAAIGADTDTSALGLSVKIDPTGGKMNDGTYDFVVEHDTIDGRSATDSVSIVVDNTAPTMQAVLQGAHVNAGTTWLNTTTGGTATFAYNVEDATSGVASVELVDGQTTVASDAPGACIGVLCTGHLSAQLTDGMHTLFLRATDVAGNTFSTTPQDVTVDTGLPTFSTVPVLAGPKTPDGSGGYWLPLSGTSNGVPYATAGVSFVAGDADVGGYHSGVDTVTLSITKVSGAVAPPPPSQSFSGCGANCTGALSAYLHDGVYRLDVLVTDLAGNSVASPPEFVVDVDTAPPTLSEALQQPYVQNGSDIWLNAQSGGTATFKYSVQDASSGLASVELLDGTTVVASATPGTCAATCSAQTIGATLADGVHVLSVRATDVAGNVITRSPMTVHVDTGIPEFGLGPTLQDPKALSGNVYWLPKAGTGTNGPYSTAVIQVTADDPNVGGVAGSKVSTITLLSDGSAADVQTFSGSCAQTCNATLSLQLLSGQHTLGVRVTDIAGNTYTSPTTFTVGADPNLPTLSNFGVLFPGSYDNSTATYWVGRYGTSSPGVGRPQVSLQTQDVDSGVGSITLEATNTDTSAVITKALPVPAGGCASGCPMAGSITLPGGRYVLRVIVQDVAQNAVVTASVNVNVDTGAPGLAQAATDGSFDNEGDMDFVHVTSGGLTTPVGEVSYVPRSSPALMYSDNSAVGASSTPPTWNKIETRLVGSTEADAASGDLHENLPIFYVLASDPVPQGTTEPSTPASVVTVQYQWSYRLATSSAWTVGRSWTSAPASVDASRGSSQHFVVASTDMLGALLASGLDPTGATDTCHMVEFRAIDSAGNYSSVKQFQFCLHLLPAPIAVAPDSGYASSGDPMSVYTHTFTAGTVGCLFRSCGVTDIDGYSGYRVAHTVVYQPWANDVTMTLNLGGSQMFLDQSSGRKVLATGTFNHRCTKAQSYTDASGTARTCMVAKAPSPSTDDPPCISSWTDADHVRAWEDQDANPRQCYDDGGASVEFPALAYERQTTPVKVEEDPLALDVLVVDSSGFPVPASSSGLVWRATLPQGVYDIYYRVPLAPSGTSWLASARTLFAGQFHAYGQHVITQERYVADGSPETVQTLHYVIDPVSGNLVTTCGNTGTCTGWSTVREEAFDYESEVKLFYLNAGALQATLPVNITDSTTTVPVARDPLTSAACAGQAVGCTAPEQYDVLHDTQETGN